jgi:hypothetical protein
MDKARYRDLIITEAKMLDMLDGRVVRDFDRRNVHCPQKGNAYLPEIEPLSPLNNNVSKLQEAALGDILTTMNPNSSMNLSPSRNASPVDMVFFSPKAAKLKKALYLPGNSSQRNMNPFGVTKRGFKPTGNILKHKSN